MSVQAPGFDNGLEEREHGLIESRGHARHLACEHGSMPVLHLVGELQTIGH